MKASTQKFIAVHKKNINDVTKVDLLTGWQLDNYMKSPTFKNSVDFISPVGARYTSKEYRAGRKLV
jgi:hypothetical protein